MIINIFIVNSRITNIFSIFRVLINVYQEGSEISIIMPVKSVRVYMTMGMRERKIERKRW